MNQRGRTSGVDLTRLKLGDYNIVDGIAPVRLISGHSGNYVVLLKCQPGATGVLVFERVLGRYAGRWQQNTGGWLGPDGWQIDPEFARVREIECPSEPQE